MKVTKVYGFSTEEIEALSKAGKILGDLSAAFNSPSDNEKALDDTTNSLIAALKDVLGRF